MSRKEPMLLLYFDYIQIALPENIALISCHAVKQFLACGLYLNFIALNPKYTDCRNCFRHAN